MAVKTKTPKPTIKAASIATVLEKGTNKILGFLVKSNRNNDYYQITTEMIAGERVFLCNCEAKDWGYDECCHIKAVKEVLLAKVELEQAEAEAALQAASSFEAIKAEIAKIETPAPVATVETPAMHFNGFGHSVNVYISDKEMAEIHARVAMTQAAEQKIAPKAKEASVKRAPQFAGFPMNDTRGFSLLKPTW